MYGKKCGAPGAMTALRETRTRPQAHENKSGRREEKKRGKAAAIN